MYLTSLSSPHNSDEKRFKKPYFSLNSSNYTAYRTHPTNATRLKKPARNAEKNFFAYSITSNVIQTG